MIYFAFKLTGVVRKWPDITANDRNDLNVQNNCPNVWLMSGLFFVFFFFCSRTMSSKATLALLIYGLIMHYSVYCSPVGLSFPSVRYVHPSLFAYSLLRLLFFFIFGEESLCVIALSNSSSSSSSRAQAKERVCFTVSYVWGYNSLLDYWITSSDSRSIGLRALK